MKPNKIHNRLTPTVISLIIFLSLFFINTSLVSAITCGPYTLNKTSDSFPLGGGSNSVNVTATAGCSWTAKSNDTWIHLSGTWGGFTGTGDTGGSIGFSSSTNVLGT